MAIRMIEYDMAIAIERAEKLRQLNQLIVRISDYIFQNSRKVRKGVKSIMGGNILELESEKLIAKGIEKGKEKGLHNFLNVTCQIRL